MAMKAQRRANGRTWFLALFIALSAPFIFLTDELYFSRSIDAHHLVQQEVDAEQVNQVLLKLGVSKAALLQVQQQGGGSFTTINNNSETRDTTTLENPVKELLELVEQQKLQIESLKKMADDSKAALNSTIIVDTTQKEKKVVEDINSNTGRVFKGKPFQEFTGERVFQSGWENRIIIANSSSVVRRNLGCTRWGVVTTIFEPTEAVRRVGTMEGWCLVIVADTKTPTNYLKAAGFENETATIKFLTVEEQQQLANSTGDMRMREFVSAIPYRHFARKNLGFLFAIRNGAEFIFDFDDDNIVNLDSATGKPVEIVPEEGTILKNVSVPLVGPSVFNPYPLMAPSLPDSWPRGLPLQAILDSTTSGTTVEQHYKDVSMDSVGVIQYLADGNPDIDAVHRLTKDLPMTFQPDSNFMSVPPHTHVPYNAQATIHTKNAFWATLLPFTVPGRVSDIWRSYFAEALFREIGLKVVFGPPRIVQDRNEHNILADMQAELDLYFKAGKLVEFLDSWKPPVVADTVPGLMEDLWIALYERGYIGLEDVQLVQLWLSALVESGYKFPKLQRRRHRNVAIMGQFYYPEPINRVLLWHQRWKELFPRIVVRGAWNTTEIQQLNAHGIEAYSHQIAEPKPGFLSPMDNLARTLTQFQDDEEIKAVLYIKDDGLLNMKTLLNGSSVIRTNEIIGTDLEGVGDISYMNPRTIQNSGEKKKYIYKIHRDGIYQNMKGENFTSAKALIKSLKYWDMYNRDHCMPAQRRLAMNFRSDPYRERDGSILFSSYTQGDMLLVPTSVASEFTNVTRLFTKAGVYLECASGTIVDMVRRKATELIKTRVLHLCTTWGGMRGKLGMVHKCRGLQKLGGFVYPVGLGKGLAAWDYAFDMVTFLK